MVLSPQVENGSAIKPFLYSADKLSVLMRIILLMFMVAAAHAATTQLKLDAFSFAPEGMKSAIQIKMMGKDGVVSPKSVWITNIKTTSLNFVTTPSGKITGDADEGFTLLGDGSNFLFTIDLLTLIMGGSGFPPLLHLDLLGHPLLQERQTHRKSHSLPSSGFCCCLWQPSFCADAKRKFPSNIQ